MADNEKTDPDRPKRIAAMAESLAKSCRKLQQHYATKAQEYGYARDVFEDMASLVVKMPDSEWLASGELSCAKFKAFVDAREREAKTVDFDVSSGTYALATPVFTNPTGSADIESLLRSARPLTDPPTWTSERTRIHAKRFESLDPELGSLYRSVWESFYAAIDQRERKALFSMRQLYDHLFDILAPDDEVRNSPYFREKTGKNPNQVHRSERIKYAANVRVVDKEVAAFLEAQDATMLALYEELNRAHKRGTLNRQEVKKVLKGMQALLELWIDALP